MRLRHTHRGRAAMVTAAAVAAGALAAGPAQAATYPGGGSTFDADAQGWVGSEQSCAPVGGGTILCSSATEHTSAVGNPAGSLVNRVNVTLNVLGLFGSTAAFTSPSFTIPAGSNVAAATFSYDRRLEGGGLIGLTPEAALTVDVVEQGSGTPAAVLTEEIAPADAFARVAVGIPAAALAPGGTYALRVRAGVSSSLAAIGLLGTTNLYLDNVRLDVLDASGAGGGDGGGGGGAGGQGGEVPIVSPGVTIRASSVSDQEIVRLFSELDQNAEVGAGPGGSLVPLERCSIVGTPGNDRIQGSRGNDVICGLGGNDVISGGRGRDVIDTANGRDRAKGGAAADMLIGVRGNDRLNAGAGNDRAGGGAGRDRISGARGRDRLGGGSGADRLAGARGRDRLGGGSGADRLAAAAGNDRLVGGKGNDRLVGGTGRDRLVAGPGRDRIFARDRTRDVVNGGAGRDRAKVDRLARGAKATKRALRKTDRVRRVEVER